VIGGEFDLTSHVIGCVDDEPVPAALKRTVRLWR